MKLMNLRSLDPSYTSEGKIGLSGGSNADREVWDEFAVDPARCKRAAEAIMASLDEPEIVHTPIGEEFDDGIQEAPEGRLLTRLHVARERNRKLVESKRKQAMKINGRLACEACGFDFAITYGGKGKGFIECHHIKPVATLVEGHTTHIDDLALVCANCHRIIHRDKKWLSIVELKAVMTGARAKVPV
jgi:5-methylcytosine-specific restriction protein A